VREFIFRFEALLRYRRYRRDLVQTLFAGVLRQRDHFQSELERIEANRGRQVDEIRQRSGRGAVDVDAAITRRLHAGRLAVKSATVMQNLRVIDQQAESCRVALLQAERDVSVLETLRDRQRRRFEYEQLRREQREMEDAWLSSRFGEYVQ